MKTTEKTNQAFNYFKKSYRYSMGGTQTVILPNGKKKYFDDREYYSGRGAKYNNNIRHDDIGDVIVTRKEYSAFLKSLKEKEIAKGKWVQEAIEKQQRVELAKKQGTYSIDSSNYVELSEEEMYGKFFDAERLANTLNISIQDAEKLRSGGKTYVFAKSENGNTYMMFHPCLCCNKLSIHITRVADEYVADFRISWGKIKDVDENQNHFVC